jgi:hypothetical protein
MRVWTQQWSFRALRWRWMFSRRASARWCRSFGRFFISETDPFAG